MYLVYNKKNFVEGQHAVNGSLWVVKLFRDNLCSSCINLYFLSQLQRACMHAEWLQLCPTLCDPMDCSLPSSSVREILQAGTQEWVSIPSSRARVCMHLFNFILQQDKT